MKLQILILAVFLAVVSCKSSENLPFEASRKVEHKLKDYLVDKLNSYNSVKTSTRNISIWIRPISVIKNCNAVYNFGISGSHHGVRELFLYQHNDIHILDNTDTTLIIGEIVTFFDSNNFSPQERNSCIFEVRRLFKENTTDVF